MQRIQIQLTDEQAKRLRELAAAQGCTLADIVRQGIDLLLQSHRPPDRKVVKHRSLQALGRFYSGLMDLAAEHDRYFYEACKKSS